MIYQLSQVSNRDTQLLYFYRILRHASTELGSIYRYDNPDVYQLDKSVEVTIDDKTMYEYHLAAKEVANRIPYLEFTSDDEVELKHIEDLVEVEVLANELIIRGDTDELTENTSVAVYWVPSLAYIDKLQKQIEALIGNLRKRRKDDAALIDKISLSTDYVMNLDGLVPNLVNIGEDEVGLIYDDSGYMLSGSVAEQTLVNPPQSLISGLIKSHIGVLTIQDMKHESKVYQGFYGGQLKLSGTFKTLVLKDITSTIFLDNITATRLIIDNCPAVLFRRSLDKEGASTSVDRLELRNSYVTVYQPITIRTLWCYKMSVFVLRKGVIHTIGFIEAGSTVVRDSEEDSTEFEELRATTMQGLFYDALPPKDKPYLEEIFLAQKPIAFQRSQIDDPVPISEAIVSIYLKHTNGSSTPGSTPSTGGKIYSPFTNWYWSGDSRVVQMIAYTGTDGKGYGGESLIKLQEVQTEIETQGVDHNILLWWGVNGLDKGAQSYADVYKSIANDVGDNAKVFVGTVGHCPDGTGSGKVDGGGGQDIVPFNEKIVQFNEDLKTALSGVSNIVVLDIYDYIKELEDEKGASWLTNDNLHYTADASRMIYDWVAEQITNVEGGSASTVTEDSDVAAVWNWFVNAGIAGISDKPEIIAGILGNIMTESPNYGDYYDLMVLGHNGTYYGMWCESNSDFRNYMSNQGFSFYAYYSEPSNSRDREAIPYELTWLTSSSSSWSQNFISNLSAPTSQTGEAGARAYAELFCVGVEICIGHDNTSDVVRDSGVANCPIWGGSYTPASKGEYQGLTVRRDRAAEVYNKYAGG